MSAMFDYISGKDESEVGRLKAQLEHVMAHCVPACALDEAREVIRDLLESYLAAFGGNKDELALRAERILEASAAMATDNEPTAELRIDHHRIEGLAPCQ